MYAFIKNSTYCLKYVLEDDCTQRNRLQRTLFVRKSHRMYTTPYIQVRIYKTQNSESKKQ
jgi:hypothetical protein